MSLKQKIQTNLKFEYNSFKTPIVLSLIVMSMFMGAFGGSVFGLLSSNFKIFADNIFSTGYGCGTFGQSEPKYGVACTTATSIVVPNSSSSLISSSLSIVNSSNSLITLSSILSSSSNIITSSSTISSASNTPSIISSSSQPVIASSLTVSSSSNLAALNTTLSVKVNLGANFNAATKQMDNNFRTRSMIPTSHPYNAQPFNYSGTEAFANSSSIPNDTVDWILIDIKDTNNVSVFTKAAILKQSGNVVDVNGSQNLSIGSFVPTQGYNYKIVIRHRNSVAIATNQNIALVLNTNTVVDLTKNINVKGSNQVQVGIDTSNQPIYGMRKGNVTGNDAIDAQDRNIGLNAQESDGIYSPNDTNLDGTVDAQDRNVLLAAPEASENI